MSMPPWGEEPEQTPPAPGATPPPPPPPPPPGPYGQQPGTAYQPYGAPSPYGAYPVPPQTNGLAIASLIVSIGGIFVCCGLTGIVGAILGHVARKQIREQPNQTGEGLALGGVVVGWITFALSLVGIVLYVVLIIAGIAVSDDSYDNGYDDDCYSDGSGGYNCY